MHLAALVVIAQKPSKERSHRPSDIIQHLLVAVFKTQEVYACHAEYVHGDW